MNISKIGDWLQVAGMLGVMASLIFVGLQLKQTQEIALSSIYQERAMAATENNAAFANNPTYLSGAAKIRANDIVSLTAQEKIALAFQAGNEMIQLENNHFQYEAGFLSDEHWQRNLDELKCFYELPFNRNVVSGWPFRASFQVVIDDAIEQAIKNPSGCWQ